MTVADEEEGGTARAASAPLCEAAGEEISSLSRRCDDCGSGERALEGDAKRLGLWMSLLLENCSSARLRESTVRSSFWILELSDFLPRL